MHDTTAVPRTTSRLAIPLLGVLAAIQGSAPNIAATALVGASRGLDMVGGAQALAASMQTLAIAASVITTGLLADRIGRRRMLVLALVTGVVGQLVVAAAPSAAVYVIGQAVSGVGLGAVYAAAFAYIQVLAVPGRLPAAVATFAAVAGAASVVITFSGGMLASVDWRVAFVLVPALSVLAIIAVRALLPVVPPSVTERRDAWGQLLLIAGMAAFLSGVSQLATSLSSPVAWTIMAGGAGLLAAFAWSQTRVRHPFFPIALFRRPLFLAALCAGFVFNFGVAASFLQLTNLWQYVLGLTPSAIETGPPVTFSAIDAPAGMLEKNSSGVAGSADASISNTWSAEVPSPTNVTVFPLTLVAPVGAVAASVDETGCIAVVGKSTQGAIAAAPMPVVTPALLVTRSSISVSTPPTFTAPPTRFPAAS